MDIPEFYMAENAIQRHDAEMVLDRFLGNLNIAQGERILDFGCGPGDITFRILSQRFHNFSCLLGVDKSPQMTDYALKNFNVEGVHFDTFDITDDASVRDLIGKWGKFTKIFSFYSLNWIKNPRSVLQNVKRLLQKGGECLLMFVGQSPFYKTCQELAKSPTWAKYFPDADDFIPFTQNSEQSTLDFSYLMLEVGIKVQACTLVEQTFTSDERLEDCMRLFSPFVSRIPMDQHHDYLLDYLTTLYTLRPDVEIDGNKHSVHYKVIVAHGRNDD